MIARTAIGYLLGSSIAFVALRLLRRAGLMDDAYQHLAAEILKQQANPTS